MKKLLLLILTLTVIIRAKAQKVGISMGPIYNIGPSACSTCQCQFDNLFRNWISENIVNYKEIYPVNYKLIDTLTDVNIKSYFETIMNPDSAYFSKYSGNSKVLVLTTLAEMKKQMLGEGYTVGKIDSISLTLKKYMELGLKPGNKVFLIKVKYGDKIIDNYAFCDTTAGKIMWDNIFYFLWIPPSSKDAFNKN